MDTIDLADCGWQRDPPDHRDFTPCHASVRKKLAKLGGHKSPGSLPVSVDWRDFFPPVLDQRQFAASPSQACAGLFQYFERRASGRLITPSRSFLHVNASRLAMQNSNCGLGLRTSLKAAVRFGLPPERYWPYAAEALQTTPDAFVYGFQADYRKVRYLRLDAATQSGAESLRKLKSFLAAGFVCTLGFPVPSTINSGSEIPFPTLHDSLLTGQAVVAVGYDDSLRIRSEKGALLVRNSWGQSWGDNGYGWLPYRYVTDRLAAEIWTLVKRSWLRSKEFTRPE